MATEAPSGSAGTTLAGRRLVVVGLGRSGLAAVRLARRLGATVVATDDRDEAELGEAASEARRLGVGLRCGGIAPGLADEADVMVVSPGVPPRLPLLQRAAARGLPVWGEVELAARHCRGAVVGVSGSNGKSTVTTLIGQMLARGPRPVRVGGNLDTPFSDLLDDDPRTLYVLELSSFQLETLSSLRPAVALLLNLSPDHLDRYDAFADYARAKARLLEMQEAQASAVLNADDPESARFAPAVRGRLFRFSTRGEVERGAFQRAKRLVLRTGPDDVELLSRRELPLAGEHNVANALAAALGARLAGAEPQAIREALAGARPLPHRLQLVASVGGVGFWNDSKATNPESTASALATFDPGRVLLILGGRDKGADWSRLIPLVRERARALLLVGEAEPLLAGLFAGVAEIECCGTIPRAVLCGLARARPGDAVLLAPGCASFDQYRDYAHRGEDFCRVVRGLIAERNHDA